MSDARPRRPDWLQCQGKEQFSSPQVAAKVARRLNSAKRRKQPGRGLHSYRCPHCNYFHLGGTGKLPN